MNISNYFYWNNVLSTQNIKSINSLLHKHKNKKEKLFIKAKNSKKTSIVYPIKLKYLKENLNKVFSYIIESNQNNYGYDIFNFNDENELHFNIYKKNQEYEWHIDSTNEKSSDIKLTVLINVSDSFFSGGNFNLLTSNNSILFPELNKPGSIIVINSNTLHKETPVTKGERKTLTIFVKGPTFK